MGLRGFFFIFPAGGGEMGKRIYAHVAQLAEHILGKDEVTSSILVMGSRIWRQRREENKH